MEYIFKFVNKNRQFTLPKEINLEDSDYLILENINSKKIWISKIYKYKYGKGIWISNIVNYKEKFKILDKISLKEKDSNFLQKILGKEFVCKTIYKNKLIIFRPPKGAFFIINKDIKLNEEIAWLIGFYFAEGTKTKNYVDIVNKELILLIKSLKIFKIYFGIEESDWQVIIKTNKKNEELELLREYWIKKLNRNIITGYSKLSYEEAIEFRINSRVLSFIFKELFNYFMNYIINNKNFAKSFLRGYIIGDGSINIRKKQLHNIGITVKNKEYLNYLIRIFNLLYNESPRVRRTKKCFEVYYCKVNILTNILLDNLFIDLNKQWSKLINGYKKKKYAKARIKYWNKIVNKSLTANQIAALSGNSHWSVRDALNLDINYGLVKAKYKNINGFGFSNKFYKLSTKGLQLLNILTKGGKM